MGDFYQFETMFFLGSMLNFGSVVGGWVSQLLGWVWVFRSPLGLAKEFFCWGLRESKFGTCWWLVVGVFFWEMIAFRNTSS